MPNFKAFTILESMEERIAKPKFLKKPSNDTLNEEVLVAAEILYELANNHTMKGLSENQNCSLQAESGKLKIGSKKRFNVLESNHPNSRTRRIPSKTTLHTSNPGSTPERFPFSIIHFLSAVRLALVAPLAVKREFVQKHLPSLTVDQILDRVRSNLSDPSILQCNEPLSELVKGAVKIFSSQTVPLALYDRWTKTWSWTGPISSYAWGLLQENLVTQFSVWFTRVQPALQLISTLPPPPRELCQSNDYKRRFNERTKLSQVTILERSDEVIAHFHREEAIRYLIPDRSFLYTNLDGEKSGVAPLRRSSDKTFAKTRGHYIFKDNRPPQFTLLSLVRDASARLPGGVGTRADICSLTRDSQYIVDGVDEKTVKQIVSGALDRLRNEVDPCVEYNGECGLWVYLHRHRKEDEDFVENGSVSMKNQGGSSKIMIRI